MPRTLIGNFKGPKGNTGEQGPQGVPGPQGLPGEKGDPGAVDENTPIIFEVPETYEIPVSGNAIKVLFGKITKGLSDLFAAVGVLASLKTVEKSTLVAAINELAEKKFDVEKIVASANITEPGFVMDGKTASEAIAELYSKKLDYEIYDNRSNETTINNHARTQEVINTCCKFNLKPLLLLVMNPNGANELILIYDIGRPYLMALKTTYYGANNVGPQLVLYRREKSKWTAPQIVNTTNATT